MIKNLIITYSIMIINLFADKLLSGFSLKIEKNSPVPASSYTIDSNKLLKINGSGNKLCQFMSLSKWILIFAVVLLAGCKAAHIYNVKQAQFSAQAHITNSDIRWAIFRAAKRANWTPKVMAYNKILASYSHKRNKFGATVIISYDLDSYDITYHSSHNLKYKKITQRTTEVSNYFTEYNPFAKSDDVAQTQSDATIHKIYNNWVSQLNQNISQELNTLSASTGYRNKAKSTNMAFAKTTGIACDDQPQEIISGQATVLRSSVNIRNGAGTRCAIVGAIHKGDEITLLGRKNNWYFIDNDKQQAWVFSSLVKILPQQQLESSVAAVNQEPLPQVPTKRISIAVIRFKTLNKEAQKIALGELVSETFTTALVNSRYFKIIEREQLDKVVKEIEMNQTGFIETTDAVEIGKILHADAIITGSVALLDGEIQLNARIIEVESAYVISADTRTARYSFSNINIIAKEIVRKLSQKLINAKQN